MAKKEIETSIVIKASANRVWHILTDFEKYPDWNPFIKSVEGEFIIGHKVEINAGGMRFKPVVLVYEEFKEIRWIGRLLTKGIFDGEHSFQIVENGDGTCTFHHGEKFNGLLVGFFSSKLDNETTTGFEQMNQKLKELAENEAYI